MISTARAHDHGGVRLSGQSLRKREGRDPKPGTRYYPGHHEPAADPDARELARRLSSETGDIVLGEELLVESNSTLVRLVNKIFLDAIEAKASDIHIESNPGRQDMRIRFRKDGVLVPYLEIASRFRAAVISRIKIMSQLDITERRKPQDGKIDFSRHGSEGVELRVAIIPTREGMEDVVLRVLTTASAISLDSLGLDDTVRANLERMISRNQGLFLVCGPTGSGKTTTLHAILSHLNNGESKIWTAEDPIEITQPGLRQVQMNPKIGWTFAAALRSFLRADPDVVMVGEMRDFETAKIGVEASLTGHLVFSTLHTNSAAESILRLLDFGLDPFSCSDALIGVLSQRLARRLCPDCKAPCRATAPEIEEMLLEYCDGTNIDRAAKWGEWASRYGAAGGGITLWKATGCAQCGFRGYQGRMGIYELLVADSSIKRLVQQRGSMSDVRALAAGAGMRTLKQDGIENVLRGLTDMHQIRAACG